jgi:hypothetical protein
MNAVPERPSVAERREYYARELDYALESLWDEMRRATDDIAAGKHRTAVGCLSLYFDDLAGDVQALIRAYRRCL